MEVVFGVQLVVCCTSFLVLPAKQGCTSLPTMCPDARCDSSQQACHLCPRAWAEQQLIQHVVTSSQTCSSDHALQHLLPTCSSKGVRHSIIVDGWDLPRPCSS